VGRASDEEDGEIPDASYLWAEADQVFATGRDVTAAFPPGTHTITLTVVDADGMSGSATIDVDVTARCDGPGDPDFPELGTPCTAGIGACLAAGMVICAPDGLGTVCSATAGTPLPEACDGIDNDCDGGVDEDGDGDGADVCVDCNDVDPAAWSTPGEVVDLRFVDATTLSWTGPSAPGGSAIVYDTLRSGAADDFASAVCVETDDGSDTMAFDPGSPATAMAFHYLVRAQNACPGAVGEGTLGAGTGGGVRSGASCP